MIKINLNQFIIYNLKSYDYIRIMDEDELCLICLDETLHTNCVLECCGKKVHSSCIKQWWDLKEMTFNNALCPHCQQRAKLKKVVNYKFNTVVPINAPISPRRIDGPSGTRYEYMNPTFGINENIRPNPDFDLTDDDILEINTNNNNVIPQNTFRYDDSEEDEIEHTTCLLIKIFLIGILILFVITAVYFLL